MATQLEKYSKVWSLLQFIGLELVAGGLIYARFDATLGILVATLSFVESAGVFGYIVRKDGFSTLFGIRRLLQAAGYAAVLGGLLLGFTGHAERGAIVTFVGTGFSMAGLFYDTLYS